MMYDVILLLLWIEIQFYALDRLISMKLLDSHNFVYILWDNTEFSLMNLSYSFL